MNVKRMGLHRMVNDADSREGRAFRWVIQVFIVVSIVSFTISTMPDLSERSLLILDLIEVVTVGIFTVEYILRVLLSTRRLQYVTSFYGIIDLVAIAPFYIATGIDLRAIRVVRLIRLVRLLKIVRYSKALQRYGQAMRMVREELVLFGFLCLLVIYAAAVGIYYFENPAQPDEFSSVFSCLWWAVATLTTVGYGDVYPITAGGRLFTFVVLMVGLSVVAVPAGLFASAMNEAFRMEREEDETPVQKDQLELEYAEQADGARDEVIK